MFSGFLHQLYFVRNTYSKFNSMVYGPKTVFRKDKITWNL
nr:MAG TPA: hypothetical protein [Caudoviricetes sp.]